MKGLRAYPDGSAVAGTACALPGDRERFLDGGFDAYLAKPFTREELIAAVRAELGAAALDGA